MSGKYRLGFQGRLERQWAEGIKSLRRIHGQVVAATERTLQRVFNNDGWLIPIPVRTVVDRRRLDQCRPRD
jgi:hypothetical protein